MSEGFPAFRPLPETVYERIADDIRQDGYTITAADVAEIHQQVGTGDKIQSILGRVTETVLQKHLASRMPHRNSEAGR